MMTKTQTRIVAQHWAAIVAMKPRIKSYRDGFQLQYDGLSKEDRDGYVGAKMQAIMGALEDLLSAMDWTSGKSAP